MYSNATFGDAVEKIKQIQEKVKEIKNDYEEKILDKLYNIPNCFSYNGLLDFEDINGQWRYNYQGEQQLFGCIKGFNDECGEICNILKNIGATQSDSNGRKKRKKIIKYICGESVYGEISKKTADTVYNWRINYVCGRTINVDGKNYATLVKINRDNANEIFEKAMNEDVGGCYIATCVYGSYDCPEVWRLRRFRDNQLSKTWYGRTFIRTYYAISPTLVKWFGETVWFKKTWKAVIDRIVLKLKDKGFEDTPYNDK